MQETKTPLPEPNTVARDTDDGRMTNLKREDVGPILVVWSSTANRQRLLEIRSKFRKALKRKWDGVIVHLRPGETIGSLKLPQTEALYESLLKMFDPDLFTMRMEKKAAVLEEQQRQEGLTPDQITDRLEAAKRQGEAEQVAAIEDASVKIEAATVQ